MSNDLTNDQMKRIAESMANMGRNGDSELVHVMPEEVALLEKIGAGTTNPRTGLREFNTTQEKLNAALKESGGSWTKEVNDLAKQRDAEKNQTYNASTNTYTSTNNSSNGNSSSSNSQGDNSIRQDLANWLTPDDGMSYVNGVLVNADGSMVNNNTSFQDAANASTPFDGKSYVNGQLVNDKTGKSVTSGHDSIFKTVANVVGLVANPVAFVAGRAINNAFDKDGDGNMFTTGGEFTFFNNENKSSTQSSATRTIVNNNDDDDRSAATNTASTQSTTGGDTDTTGASNEAGTYSEISDAPTYRAPGFTSRPERRKFINYDYTDGTGKPVGTYNGNAKPFHVATSAESIESFVLAETASNAIDTMVSSMSPEVQDKLNGDISVQLTADNQIALYVGNDDTGYVEAVYAADDNGMNTAMTDVANMLAYGESSGDLNIDAGYTGRVRSAARFTGYDDNTLNQQYAMLKSEGSNYEQGSPLYLLWLERVQEFEDEIKRRDGDPAASSAEYSVTGLTRSVAESAAGFFA
jgi:hypothetical protein